MCGRYTLIASDEALIAEFDLYSCEPVEPSRNIAPTQQVPVVRLSADGRRVLSKLRWGLIPSWSQDPANAYKMINARSEEAAIKPAFSEPFRRRRCLVPCSGFYEWKAVEGAPKRAKKQAYLFRREDESVFALAGLWESWRVPDGQALESFTILTTAAAEIVAPIHDRMPVMIPRENYGPWLDATLTGAPQIQQVLAGSSARGLICVPVESP